MGTSETLQVGSIVELHPGLDRWTMGDRYGTVTKRYASGNVRLKLHRSGRTMRSVHPCYLAATGHMDLDYSQA